MRRKDCLRLLSAAMACIGCNSGLSTSDWQDAPVIYHTATPPETALIPSGPSRRRRVYHAVWDEDGIRLYPPPSGTLTAALTEAELPAPGEKSLLPPELLEHLPQLAELAAAVRRRARFNSEGTKRYGFRQMKPNGGFDFKPGALHKTGREADLAISGGSGRDFLVLIPSSEEGKSADVQSVVLARSARVIDHKVEGRYSAVAMLSSSGASLFGRAVPSALHIPPEAALESSNGTYFKLPEGTAVSFENAAKGRVVTSYLEGPNVDFDQLRTDLELAAELEALLECLARSPVPTSRPGEFILGSPLVITAEFLSSSGIVIKREQGASTIRIRPEEKHRAAIVSALEALMLRLSVVRENLRHANDTASSPEKLYQPRSVVLEPDGTTRIETLDVEPRRIYAPKDQNADDGGYVFSPSVVPELEREAYRATAGEYEILRRAAERVFLEIVFPQVGVPDSLEGTSP